MQGVTYSIQTRHIICNTLLNIIIIIYTNSLFQLSLLFAVSGLMYGCFIKERLNIPHQCYILKTPLVLRYDELSFVMRQGIVCNSVCPITACWKVQGQWQVAQCEVLTSVHSILLDAWATFWLVYYSISNRLAWEIVLLKMIRWMLSSQKTLGIMHTYLSGCLFRDVFFNKWWKLTQVEVLILVTYEVLTFHCNVINRCTPHMVLSKPILQFLSFPPPSG